MSGIVDQKQPIKVKITKDFSGYFDEILNVQLGNRRSEKGFIDDNRLIAKMRPGSSKYGSNTLTGGTGTSRLFFHTDFFGNRIAIRGYKNRVYWLYGTTWTDLGVDFLGNQFWYNTVKLPMNVNLSIPTEYTNGANATNSERIKKAVGDAGGASNIGKTIFITDNSGDNQSYRGCYADITDYDTTTSEYILGTSGIIGKPDNTDPTNIIGIASGSKYQIYDQLGEYLQVMNGISYDRYFMSSGTAFTENTSFQGFATKSLRTIQAITSSQFINKQILFNNAFRSFNKGTIYESSGELGNPFFHTFSGARTISNKGYVIDIFTFGNKLIIGGNNFVKTLDTSNNFDTISDSWGIKKNGFIDFNIDAYIFSSDKQLFSLVENIKGTIIAQNIGKQVQNYMDEFDTEVCMGFDGKRFYLYGQPDSSTAAKLLTLDIRYKFWSPWTGIRPSSMVSENGVMYMTDNNSETVRYIDNTVQTDTGTIIEQKMTTREIDLGDIFSQKLLPKLLLWFDNYDQQVNVKIFASLNRKQATIVSKNLDITENFQLNPAPSIGSGIIGAGIIGGDPFIENISYPILESIVTSNDSANMWKVEITGIDGSPFYLGQMDIVIGFYGDRQEYFDASHTH